MKFFDMKHDCGCSFNEAIQKTVDRAPDSYDHLGVIEKQQVQITKLREIVGTLGQIMFDAGMITIDQVEEMLGYTIKVQQ